MFRQAFLALALALSVGICHGCAIPTSVNSATLNLIKGAEGFVQSPAPDPIGLPTVGYGHLCKTKRCSEVPHPFPLTKSAASSLLESDLKTFISCVYNDIHPSVKLNDNQFGALVAWAFNVGCGNVAKSDVVSRLNKGENPDVVASEELPKWNKARNGSVLRGLVTRRADEVKLFKTASRAIVHPC
ncbi:hypothetical protein D9613_009816 [Agrocybe pediades]|uniref:Lysozyme n=1 Tax=Agrocybe pediades TaxID=84607 RepID=A0A8H4QWB4_9AGAR|nr:hypothetical protein D9613_009816 [Agrocybe pediades]